MFTWRALDARLQLLMQLYNKYNARLQLPDVMQRDECRYARYHCRITSKLKSPGARLEFFLQDVTVEYSAKMQAGRRFPPWIQTRSMTSVV